jgi:hypothetical protein
MLLTAERKMGVPSLGRILSLAASPTFVGMAAWQSFHGITTCSAMGIGVLDGMTVMYGLMAIVHLPPWTALVLRSNNGVCLTP